MVCPNKNSQEWINLENAVGSKRAYSIFINNGYTIPSNDVIEYLTKAKISEKEINWIKNKLPSHMDISVFEDLANLSSTGDQTVWGEYKNNVLRLSDLAEKGTGYHEYFHGIFRTYFSQEEIDAYLQLAANEIDQLLIDQNKSITKYIAEKQSTFIETGLTTQDKVNLLYEEYLADNFAKFMNKKEHNNVFEKLFEALKSFIKFIFNNQRSLDLLFHKISNNDFRNQRIALNKYQEGYLQDMAYVRILNKEPSFVNGQLILNKFGVEESQQIIRDLAKIYFTLKNSDYYSKNEFNNNKLLDTAIEIMRNYANSTNNEGLVFALNNDSNVLRPDPSGQKEHDYIKDTVKSYIKSISPYFSFNEDIQTDEESLDVNEEGDPLGNGEDRENENPRNDSFGKESAEKQGWSRLPQFLREYISTSSYVERDINGNPILLSNFELPDGSVLPIYKEKTINVNKIYFSLTRSLINTPSDITRLLKMYEISRTNSEQKAFVDRFFLDSNLDIARLDEMEQSQKFISRRVDGTFSLKDITLIQAVLKGFDKYSQDPLMLAIDTNLQKSTVALANRNNAAAVFYDNWQSNFESLMFTGTEFNSAVWNPIISTRDRIERAVEPNSFTSEQDIKDKANYVIDQLEKIGINLSQGFVEYSIINNLKSTGKLNGKDPASLKLKNKLSRIKLAKENVLTKKAIVDLFKSIESQGNPFQVVELEEDSNATTNDASRKILALAQGNVKFDESAFETSYIASDGTIRYGHQDATLHLMEVSKMNDADYLNKVLETGIRDEKKGTAINGQFYEIDKEDADFRTKSLFNQKDNGITKLLKDNQPVNFVIRPADGLKEDSLARNDEGQMVRTTFVKKGESEGVHFGDMTERDYAVYLLNLSLESYETQDILDNNGNLVERIFFSPVTLGMMETSKTHHFLYLPILRNLYSEKGITDYAVTLLYNEIEKEYSRIRRVAQQLQEGPEGNKSFINIGRAEELQLEGKMPFIFSNYHHKDFNFSKGRALQFSDFNAGFISSEMSNLLRDSAIDDKDIEGFVERIKEDIIKQFDGIDGILNQHISELKSLGAITEKSAGTYSSELLSSNFMLNSKDKNSNTESSKIKLQQYAGLNNGFKANLGHIILNQHLNAINVLHIMNGDPALMYKADGVGTDFYKRMKTSNGAGISASHNHNYLDKPDGFQRMNGVVLQEPTVSSKFTKNEKGEADSIDVADAQMYLNIKALKHVLLGFGKLNEPIADLIVNKIEKGIPLSKEDLFDSGVIIEQDRFINPYKFIFRDPSSTFKISAFILTQNLLEINIGTEENPNWVSRKDKEDLHEIYSLMNEKNVDFAVFETGSKTMTPNVVRRNEEGKYDLNKVFPISYNTDYLRLQLENPSNKTEITSPTQLIQQIDTEQDLNATGYIDGKPVKIGEVIDQYTSAIANKHNINYLVARNGFYTISDLSRDLQESIKNKTIEPRLAEFQKSALKGLLDSGADTQLVDFFRTEVVNGIEVPKYDINNPKTIEKFINLYYSYFSKGTFSLKNKGFAAALVSSYGFTPIKKVKEIKEDGSVVWEVLRSNGNEYKNLHKNSDLEINQITYSDEKTFKLLTIGDLTIDEIREKLKTETVYFKDRLQYGVPRYQNGVVTGYFAETLFPNHYPDYNDTGDIIPDSIRYMFGNRIPLQDKHSMMNFEVVDFLPMEYGSSLVAPQEIVEFSGADYDIDKEYLTVSPVYNADGEMNSYYIGEDWNRRYKDYLTYMGKEVKEVKKKVKGNKTITSVLSDLGLPSTKEEYQSYVEANGEINNGVNERIVFESMLTLYSNQSMVDRGIPMAPANQRKLTSLANHPYFIKGDVKYFDRKLTGPALTPLQLIRTKRANNVGKDNIGIAVNSAKVFTLLNKADVKITDDEQKIFYNNKEYSSFGNQLAEDGDRIIDNQSTLTSAATDEAKDSNSAKFGLGLDELKATEVLLSLGMSLADAVLIINQPVIKEFTKLLNSNNHAIKTSSEKDVSSRQEDLIEQAFQNLKISNQDTAMNEIVPEKLSNILFGDLGTDFAEQQSAVMKLFSKALEHNGIFTSVAAIMKLTNGIEYSSIEKIKRAKKNLQLDQKGRQEEEIFQGLRYALTGDNNFESNNGYVNKLAAAQLNNLTELEQLNSLVFLTNSPSFQRILKEIDTIYSYASPEDKKQFEKDLLSYLTLSTYKSFYYNEDLNPNDNFKSGFIYNTKNTESIIDKFNEIKQKVNNDPDYVDLKSNSLIGTRGQLLAKSAILKVKDKKGVVKTRKSPTLDINQLVMRTTSKKNEAQQSELALAFLQLKEDPRTEEFADALLDFELVKDGLQFQFQTIGSIFPVEMYDVSLGYENSSISYVRKFMEASNKAELLEFAEELQLNDYDISSIGTNGTYNEVKDDITKILFNKSYRDFVNDFYKLKFTNAKSFRKIRSISLDKNILTNKNNNVYNFNLKTNELIINRLSGLKGLSGEAAVNKKSENDSALRNAQFYNNATKEVYFPRYVRSYLTLKGETLNYLLEYQEDQRVRYSLDTLKLKQKELKSDYTLDSDEKFFNNQLLEEIKEEIKELESKLSNFATYKVVEVIGTAKVAPWLNLEGEIPTATIYQKQAKIINSYNKTEIVPVEETTPVQEPDLILPDYTPEFEETTNEPKGPIESSLGQESKSILEVDNVKLQYGISPQEIIKNNKC